MTKRKRDDENDSSKSRVPSAINLTFTATWKAFGDFERLYHKMHPDIWGITVGAKFLKRHKDDLANFIRGGANVCVDLHHLKEASVLKRSFQRCLKMETEHVVMPMYDLGLLRLAAEAAICSETDILAALPATAKTKREIAAYARCARETGVRGILCPGGYVKELRDSGDQLLLGAKYFATDVVLNPKGANGASADPCVTAEEALQGGAHCIVVPFENLSSNLMALRACNERIEKARRQWHSLVSLTT